MIKNIKNLLIGNNFKLISYIIFILIIILFFIPFLWNDRIKLDFAKLTEEWYKHWFSLVLIFISFLLINVFWENYKKQRIISESLKEKIILIRELKKISQNLIGAINYLSQPNISNKEFQSTIKELMLNLENYQSYYENNIKKAIFNNDLNIYLTSQEIKNIQQILDDIKEGKIIYVRNFTKQYKQVISFVINTSNKTITKINNLLN